MADSPSLRRQDAARAMPLGVFRDGVLLEVLPAGATGELVATGAGVEVLALCPDHPTASAVDCLDCEPA